MDTADLDTTLTETPTPTPTTILGCAMQQQQQQQQQNPPQQLVDGSGMDSTESMLPNLQAELGDDFHADLMQSILSNQPQQANPNESQLTWL